MVEMTDSSLLVERKATYAAAIGNTAIKENNISRKYLNGDVSYFDRKERSNSECSSDSALDNLFEAADRIRDGQNGSPKKGKKKVRFNMARNEEFTYSYTQYTVESSDDEGSGQSALSSNVNLVGFDFMNGHDEGHDEDDDSGDDYDDDEEDDDEEDDDEYDTETSEDGNHGLGKYGYLVDKSSEQNKDINGNIGTLENGTDKHIGKQPQYEHQEIASTKMYNDKIVNEKESQVLQFEASLLQRKSSVQRQLSDLSSTLKRTREEADREMEQLKNDLEARRRGYQTEIEDVNRRREEQKRKFEEELEEFQNEKKLEERRERYHEHEALITGKEAELEERKRQAVEQDREVREYEEYLNRRHAVCNNKEEDLTLLQNELDTLSQELEAKRERLLNKSKKLDQEMQQVEQPESAAAFVLPPLLERRGRSASRASTLGRGTDMRIEELKHQNKQLLEELFSLRKALETGNEQAEESQQTMAVLASENKRLMQKVKNLESQLELARKSAELSSDTQSPSVDEILRKTTAGMRNSRVLRPSRISALSSTGSHTRLSREPSKESLHSKESKGSGSSDSGKGSKESGNRNAKESSKNPKDSSGKDRERTKTGSEKVTSALCAVM